MSNIVAIAWAIIFPIFEPPPPSPQDAEYVILTAYDDALCNPGEVCVQGDGDGLFASGIPTGEHAYYIAAACDAELYWWEIRVGNMYLKCIDSFGTWNGLPVVTTGYDEDGVIYTRVDAYWPLHKGEWPSWAAQRFYDWNIVGYLPYPLVLGE